MKSALPPFLVLLAVTVPSDRIEGAPRDPISHETATRQARPRFAGEKFDPQESDPRLRKIFAAADVEAERLVVNVRRDERFILQFWAAKKAILRRKYGIDWRTPAELNPSVVYDSYGQPRVTQREIREITPIVQRHMHDRREKIVNFERTFEGDINVWTNVGNTEQSGMYLVRRANKTWRIVDYHLVVP